MKKEMYHLFSFCLTLLWYRTTIMMPFTGKKKNNMLVFSVPNQTMVRGMILTNFFTGK